MGRSTQMEGQVSPTLEVVFTCFAQPLQTLACRNVRLEEGVDVAQGALEPDGEPRVPAGVTFSPVVDDAPLGTLPHCSGNRAATLVRRVDPSSTTHSSSYSSVCPPNAAV
jgi:hypothetical protein